MNIPTWALDFPLKVYNYSPSICKYLPSACQYLPSLDNLSENSSILTNEQKGLFITLFACGIIISLKGLYSCCQSKNTSKSSVQPILFPLGVTLIVANYMLLNSALQTICP